MLKSAQPCTEAWGADSTAYMSV